MNKEVASVKALWKNHLVDGATWETEADIKSSYPHLFDNYGYLFLLVMKIMTKNWCFLIFSEVLQIYAFLVELQNVHLDLKICNSSCFELCCAFLYGKSLWNNMKHVDKLWFGIIGSYMIMMSSCSYCEKEIPHNVILSLICSYWSFKLPCINDMIDVVLYSWVYSFLQTIDFVMYC